MNPRTPQTLQKSIASDNHLLLRHFEEAKQLFLDSVKRHQAHQFLNGTSYLREGFLYYHFFLPVICMSAGSNFFHLWTSLWLLMFSKLCFFNRVLSVFTVNPDL